MEEKFPDSLVVLTQKQDPWRPWNYKPEDMEFPCISLPENIHISTHMAISTGIQNIIKQSRNRPVIHLLESISGLNSWLIINRCKSNYYLMVNDGGFPEVTLRPTQRLRWLLIGRHCYGVLTPGNAGRHYMMAWGFPSDRIYNSYLSIDVNKFSRFRASEQASRQREKIRRKLGLTSDDILALCVSRLLDWKRLEDLSESLVYLPESVKKKLFVLIIGNGQFRDPINKINNIAGSRFEWIESTEYEEMVNYYAASDFFVLPSEGDIWGLVINEALAMGKPVICTRRIGASELVKDGWNGFKVPVRSPQAIADAITVLTEDQNRRNLMAKNATSIKDTWNSGKYINQLERIVNDIGLEEENI